MGILKGASRRDRPRPIDQAVTAYSASDYAEAFGLFKTLAEAGDVRAQVYLSWLYRHGQGTAQNFVEAHKWAGLAATAGSERAENYRRSIATFMTDRELAQAQWLARVWQPRPTGRSLLHSLLARLRRKPAEDRIAVTGRTLPLPPSKRPPRPRRTEPSSTPSVPSQ